MNPKPYNSFKPAFYHVDLYDSIPRKPHFVKKKKLSDNPADPLLALTILTLQAETNVAYFSADGPDVST